MYCMHVCLIQLQSMKYQLQGTLFFQYTIYVKYLFHVCMCQHQLGNPPLLTPNKQLCLQFLLTYYTPRFVLHNGIGTLVVTGHYTCPSLCPDVRNDWVSQRWFITCYQNLDVHIHLSWILDSHLSTRTNSELYSRMKWKLFTTYMYFLSENEYRKQQIKDD